MILSELLYIAFTLFAAGKDADSYLLKDNSGSRLNLSRVKRWHRDGFIQALIVASLCALIDTAHWWQIAGYCLLIRLSFFDIAFNKWSGLQWTYLGGTAATDKLFVKVFGINGAVEKSVIFFVALVALNLIQIFA